MSLDPLIPKVTSRKVQGGLKKKLVYLGQYKQKRRRTKSPRRRRK